MSPSAGGNLPGSRCNGHAGRPLRRIARVPHDPAQVLSPSQLNTLARDLLESALGTVWVRGEISNLARPASGHLYFTLKDERAQVRCAMFKPKSQWLRFKPGDGMQVVGSGRVTLYEARGDYQLVIDHLDEAGAGALRLAFDQLKAKLAAEGLFASERKRALPALVRRLGVITSPSGAAVRDVLSVLARRFPLLAVELLPVPVQGNEAAAQIVRMLQRADASGRYDALLLTRGGGSLEDLWCFNDEALVRAIAQLRTPLVSAVGHEIDFTLADFAADLRAPTPSAAAELLVPERSALHARLQHLHERALATLQRRMRDAVQACDRAALALAHAGPKQRLARGGERLLTLHARLSRLRQHLGTRSRERLSALTQRLSRCHPALSLPRRRQELQVWQARSSRAIGHALMRRRERSDALARALSALSPLTTTQRGYAVLRRVDDAQVIRSWQQATVGERVRAELAMGNLLLQVLERSGDTDATTGD